MDDSRDELERLIEEQRLDMTRGHRLWGRGLTSLDKIDYNLRPRRGRQFRFPLSMSDSRHGTVAGYSSGCRCKPCKAARADAQKRWRAARKGSPNTPHGTVNGYNNYQCRCRRCKKAWNVHMKAYQKRRRENG